MDALRALVARFEASLAALPDMTALDWASDHGWIEPAEHEAGEQRLRDHRALCEELRAEIGRLRAADAKAFEAAVRDEKIAVAIAAIER